MKKPYNPILGEVFQCSWDYGEQGKTYYIAEQVPSSPPPLPPPIEQKWSNRFNSLLLPSPPAECRRPAAASALRCVGGWMHELSLSLAAAAPPLLTYMGIPVSVPHVSPCTQPLVWSVVLRHQRTPPPPSQHRALPPLLPYPHIPLVNLPGLLLPKVKNSSVRHPRLFCSQRHPNHTVECTGLFRITYT